MKYYIAIVSITKNYDDWENYVIGVFNSEDAARKKAKEFVNEYPKKYPGSLGSSSIKESEIQVAEANVDSVIQFHIGY